MAVGAHPNSGLKGGLLKAHYSTSRKLRLQSMRGAPGVGTRAGDHNNLVGNRHQGAAHHYY